jgi:hypothetical protein
VLDAGPAAELAVTKLIRSHLAAAGHPNIDGELRANSMLGRLCGYWARGCGGCVGGFVSPLDEPGLVIGGEGSQLASSARVSGRNPTVELRPETSAALSNRRF